MSLSIAIGIAVFTFLAVLFIQRKRKFSRLPPGPSPLPVIGNFHQIRTASMAVDLTRLGKKYGGIFTVHFLTSPVIVINSYEVMKDLLVSHEYADIFSGRLSSYISTNLLPHSLIFQDVTEGQQYMRRVVMRGIKQYGAHLKHVEHLAQHELEKLILTVKELKGAAVNPSGFINMFTSNIMMILICGRNFDADHHLMQLAVQFARDYMYLLNYKHQILMDNVPFVTSIHPGLKRASTQMARDTTEFTDTLIKMRKEGELKEECLFSVLEEEERLGNISRDFVKGMLLDMMLTGVLTTSPSISLTLLAMAQFPGIQKKIYEEIVEVVGTDRLPGLEDKVNMPYSHATILEVFRYFAPVPLPGPRNCTKDCTYRGYFIPKDTIATYNVWNVHHDEDFWDRPYDFDPSRFLDSEGSLIPPEHERRMRLVTFGLGKRSCVGEILARVRMFLATTALVQNFHITEDPDHPLPSSDPRTYHIMFMTTPPPYKIKFLSRKDKSVNNN